MLSSLHKPFFYKSPVGKINFDITLFTVAVGIICKKA